MAYTHSKYEAIIATDQALTAAADVADWAPGFQPHILRAVAVVFTTAVNNTGTLTVNLRPTAGSNSGRTALTTVTYTTTSGAQGRVVYRNGLNSKITPGQELVAEVTDAAPTAGNAHIIYYVEPTWEQPGNNAQMSATT